MTEPNATYYVGINWYADGDFDDDIDDVSADVLGEPGLTVEYGRDTARATAPPMIGAVDFALMNQDREYSPGNPSTARYQFVRPGRPLRVRASWGDRGLYRSHGLYREHDAYRGRGVFPLLSGYTETFEQRPRWGERIVTATGLGTIARLRRTPATVPLATNVRTDVAILSVLNAAGWPGDMHDLAVGDSTLTYFWSDDRPAWDVLVELTATEGAGALFYEDPWGILHWQNRNYRAVSTRSTTVQATFHDGTAASGLAYTDLTYDPRWGDIINRAVVKITQREPTTQEAVWKLGADFTLNDGATEILTARPSLPFVDAITPALTTDYTVTNGTVTITLPAATGAVAQISILGTSGTPIVSGLQLRATPVEVLGETQIESSVPVSSEDERKTHTIPAWPELGPGQAQAICDSYVARYKESRPIMELTFQNADTAHMEAILRLQISDRVRVINQFLGIDADVYVEKIRHAITTGGRHELTLACEPVSEIGSLGSAWDAGVWDTATWGI